MHAERAGYSPGSPRRTTWGTIPAITEIPGREAKEPCWDLRLLENCPPRPRQDAHPDQIRVEGYCYSCMTYLDTYDYSHKGGPERICAGRRRKVELGYNRSDSRGRPTARQSANLFPPQSPSLTTAPATQTAPTTNTPRPTNITTPADIEKMLQETMQKSLAGFLQGFQPTPPPGSSASGFGGTPTPTPALAPTPSPAAAPSTTTKQRGRQSSSKKATAQKKIVKQEPSADIIAQLMHTVQGLASEVKSMRSTWLTPQQPTAPPPAGLYPPLSSSPPQPHNLAASFANNPATPTEVAQGPTLPAELPGQAINLITPEDRKPFARTPSERQGSATLWDQMSSDDGMQGIGDSPLSDADTQPDASLQPDTNPDDSPDDNSRDETRGTPPRRPVSVQRPKSTRATKSTARTTKTAAATAPATTTAAQPDNPVGASHVERPKKTRGSRGAKK